MTAGTLAWRNSTAALLWEIWGRHKLKFGWHGVALLVGMACVRLAGHGDSVIVTMGLAMVGIMSFMSSFLTLLAWFAYAEMDGRQFRFGFPGRLLLKPVSTLRLALTPMIFGGAVVTAHLWLWNRLGLQHLITSPDGEPLSVVDPGWLMALVVSFFWWMQAVAWGTPQAQWRVLILLMVGVVHLLVWSLPRLSDAVGRGWWWVILMAMLASSMPVAVMGLQWVREGRWEGPSRLALMRTAWQPARGRLGRRFGSAFGAQFWFEWRRFGWALPGVAMTVYFVILPLIKMVMTKQGAGGDFGMVGAGLIVAAPLTVAGLLGAGVGDFGAAEPGGGLPEYLAVRPMSNGDFVLAKMAMALAASALTWAAAVLASWMWLPAPHDLGSAMAWGVPAWALLVLFTWKNLLGGMWASLTGRQWVAMVAMVVRLGGLFGIMAVVFWAKYNWQFRESLLPWLSWALAAGLAGKVIFSAGAFAWGRRRNAITVRAAGCIVAGWLLGGLFLAGYAHWICGALNRLDLWAWTALGGFLFLPLADLAMAPVAMACNRHR